MPIWHVYIKISRTGNNPFSFSKCIQLYQINAFNSNIQRLGTNSAVRKWPSRNCKNSNQIQLYIYWPLSEWIHLSQTNQAVLTPNFDLDISLAIKLFLSVVTLNNLLLLSRSRQIFWSNKIGCPQTICFNCLRW